MAHGACIIQLTGDQHVIEIPDVRIAVGAVVGEFGYEGFASGYNVSSEIGSRLRLDVHFSRGTSGTAIGCFGGE